MLALSKFYYDSEVEKISSNNIFCQRSNLSSSNIDMSSHENVLLFSQSFREHFKDSVLSIMLHAPLLSFLFALSEASIVFRGFAFLAGSIQLGGKKFLRLVLQISLNLLY